MACERDHRGVVGAEFRAREVHARAGCVDRPGECRAQPAVDADAARDGQSVDARLAQRSQGLRDQCVDHRVLEAARHVRAGRVVEHASAYGDDHGGLESAEAEIEPWPVEHRARKLDGAGAAALGERRERGPAGVAEVEEFRRLVEGLSCRIVQRLSEDAVPPKARYFHQHRVPARDLQGHEREIRRVRLQRRRQEMPFEVVHADDRHAPGIAQRAGEAGADQQRANQTRPGGIGNPVNGLSRQPGLGQGVVNHRQQALNVLAGGELGDDAAVLRVQRDLAEDAVGEQALMAVVEGDRGLVAGGFDAEDQHGPRFLIFRGQVTTIPALSPGVPGAVQGSVEVRMPSVRIRENEYFDAALRRFKRACEKAGVLTELRRREFYEKPTQERKRKKAAAIKRHLKRNSRDGSRGAMR